MTTNGDLVTLVSFAVTNGAGPACKLTPGNDGYFYGTTSAGGSAGLGTIFRLSISSSPVAIQFPAYPTAT